MALERQAVERQGLTRHTYGQQPRHPLVVCASLVQNAANLGGLCRTAEGLRLERLVVANRAIAHAPEFKRLAASSQHWQPLIECAPANLPGWLQQQRQAGYTLVGLQADPAAVPITQWNVPQRTVLVLGQELTGIPPTIMACCQQAVTIPQYGLVESFSVQVAGAIAMYEYVRQHGGRVEATKLASEPADGAADELQEG